MQRMLKTSLHVAFAIGAVACAPQLNAPEAPISSIDLDGAIFEIADAAISSNCLSLAFAVRGYSLPAGAHPQHGFPPAKSIAIRTGSLGAPLNPIPLGGGGGGGGNDEDGRVWMRQETQYSLSAPVPEGAQVPLEITVFLNDDFGIAEPLEYRVFVVAGPGGGFCPRPEATHSGSGDFRASGGRPDNSRERTQPQRNVKYEVAAPLSSRPLAGNERFSASMAVLLNRDPHVWTDTDHHAYLAIPS